MLLAQSEAVIHTAVDPYVLYKFIVQKYVPITKKISLYVDGVLTMANRNDIGFTGFSKIVGIAPILNSSISFW